MDHYWNAAGHRETYFWASIQTTMETDWYPGLCKQMIRCCFNVLFKLSFSCLHLLVWKCSGTFASASNWNTLLLYVWKHGRHQSGNPSGYRPDDDLASGYPWNNGYLETLSAARLTARYVRRMRETFQLISINKYLRMNADTCLWAYNQCVIFQLMLSASSTIHMKLPSCNQSPLRKYYLETYKWKPKSCSLGYRTRIHLQISVCKT